MSLTIQPRRSVLYMPGSRASALVKARTLPADSLIFDLEDAVAPTAKQEARQHIITAIQQGDYGHRELIVRVNGLDTPWGYDDLKMVAHLPIQGVLLPKVNSATQVIEAIGLLDANNNASSLAIWIMIETPQGVLNIHDIIRGCPRLKGIILGTSDLSKALQIRHTPERLGLLVPLSLCVLAARAYHLSIIDGVHLDLEDNENFKIVCEQGRDLGFDGKTLIHPKQIAIANQVFAPTVREIAQAHQIILAWEQAQQEGKGVVLIEGKLVENLHVEEAKHCLARAKICAERSS
jgi:citrate lyase subunit beta/citryl-CoA lyase